MDCKNSAQPEKIGLLSTAFDEFMANHRIPKIHHNIHNHPIQYAV